MDASPIPGSLRAYARAVVILFAATLALGILLLVLFEPDVQTIEAGELAERSGDARAFLIADFFFIALYAILTPLAQWRFGRALADGAGPPNWIKAAALLFVAAGIVDAVENVLLLSATGKVEAGRIDAAHALAIPKVALFVAATLLALAILARAIQTLRR